MLLQRLLRSWAAAAHAAVNQSPSPVVDEEAIDAAGVYVADCLRAFAESPVGGVLIEGPEGGIAPIRNLADHYRWDVGLRSGSEIQVGGVRGVVVPADYWRGSEALGSPAAGFRFAELPADVAPERVLERLAALRA